MNALVLLVAASAVGIDVGWLPLTDGGVEYIIQIEPELVDQLLKKNDLESAIPSGLDVRRFRVTVGTGKLPRQSAPAAAGSPSGAGQPTNAAGPAAGSAPPAATAPIVAPIPGAAAPASGSSGVQPIGPPPNGFQPGGFPPPNPAGAAPAGGPPPRGPNASPADVPFNDAGASTRGVPTPLSPGANPLAGGASAAVGGGLASGDVAGPSLDSPTANPLGKHARDAVSQAFNDPNAPGRVAGADTGQPHLTQDEMLATRRMGSDFSSGGQGISGPGNLLASAHEMNRPSEFERGGNSNGMGLPNNFGANGNNNSGGRGFNNPNDRSPGDRSENFSAAGLAVAHASEPAEKPWPTLIFTVTLLLASVSLNFYLGWVAWDSRFRYRELLAQNGDLPLTV